MEVFELDDGRGTRARLGTWGARLLGLETPDRHGEPGPVVLGFADPARYAHAHPYLGATAGRFANRIAHGRFELDGREVRLVCNEGAHHLHGGTSGFSHAEWRGRAEDRGVVFEYTSPDGEQGYPGRLEAKVRYTLADGALRIDFEARSDAPTVVNLTHHSYFNLRDGGRSPILDHELEVAAERFAPVDADGIPTGALEPVAATPLDFREPRPIGERIDALAGRGGYDHCFELEPRSGLAWAARLRDRTSGRVLDVRTTQPALQLYSGNFLDGDPWPARHALCLETQHFPDSPNHAGFPSTRLDPGEVYAESVVYAFSVED